MTQNEENMVKLVDYLVENGFRYEYDICMLTCFSKTVNNKCCVFALTEPHDGNKNRWMLRAEMKGLFDRWSNASYEEFYDTVDDFVARALIDLEKKWN